MDLKVEAHKQFLKEKIFQIGNKWPHFERLIQDVEKIGQSVKETDTVAILERSYIYGGVSLFAPLFNRCNLISIDCQTLTAEERGGYQANWTNDARCLHIKSAKKAPITNTTLQDNSCDILIVPNVVHHERDQDGMFNEFFRILKPGGRGYIFEALLRELHQIPDDYVRYTPWGFEYMLQKSGLNMVDYKTSGGPFEAISYCWDQALQYIPDGEQEELKSWFKSKHFQELLDLDKKYPENVKRDHTSFPVAYSVYFEK